MANLIALQSGTELVGDFRIERMLGAGGFGITYLADEMALDRHVTIKEYFPSDFAARADGIEAGPRSQDCASDYRWGLDRFIAEAQTLAKFNHPNIVRVYRYFRANNTGYMVLHFEEGLSLKSWLKGLGRAPRQKELDAIVAPLLDALELIHKADFLHRDIAPDNIIIRKDGEPVLIDFGSARRELASHSKTVSALVKPGYSPYEQYAETSRQQGPWTDIYALGATLYHAVTGKRPADSPSRMVKDELVPAREAALSSYRPAFLNGIDHALALTVEARPQSVAAWRGALTAPEPARPGWLSRTLRPKDARKEPAAGGVLAGAFPSPEPAHPLPPPPDAPGPQGGMLDFFDALKRKPSPKKSVTGPPAASTPQASPAPAAPVPAAPAPTAKTEMIETPAPAKKPPRVFKVKSDVKKDEAKERRKAPRPRPIRIGRGKRWRPILFKLLIGAGVASAAVAMQDKLPRFESRGAGVTSATTKAGEQQAFDVKPLAELKGHIGAVTTVLYTEDGNSIVTAGEDARLKVWRASTGDLIRTIELDNGPATTVALSGSRALTGHGSGEIVLWDFERAEKISTFKRNEAEVWSVVFAGRPDRFAAASHDWKVALWDVANTAGPVQVIDAHENAAQALAFSVSPQGPLLASGGADKTVKLWNLDTFDHVRTYRGHTDFVTALAFSPSGRTLASSGLDGTVRIWSTTSSRVLRRLYGHHGRVSALAFAPSGETLASAGVDGQLRIWDINRGRTARTIVGHTGAVMAVGFSPDGERIASAGQDGVVRLWANPVQRAATN
jgi:WD40 repeat protein/serine/threonine protein kinase